jgi:hypothetical protein
MGTQDVEAAIMLPTPGVAVEYDMCGDAGLLYASLRAFNRWLEEDWDTVAQAGIPIAFHMSNSGYNTSTGRCGQRSRTPPPT